MCKFWSGIINRDGKVFYRKEDSSHENIIKDAKLKDDKLVNRDFVRFEITPKNVFSKKKADWSFKVDEEGTLPEWFSSRRKFFEDTCWLEWEKVMKVTLWKLDMSAVSKFVGEIPKIPYFKPDGKPLKKWKLFTAPTWDAARNAAWDAARDAARVAAWDAARNAAWDAARNAAGDAAGVAAWDAARVAAWDAAWDAAGDAAWDAAGDAELYARCALSLKLKNFDKKHFLHAKARMEVWRKGYALKCDVNGVLYVYEKK